MIIKSSKIYVAGQKGLVGSAIVRELNRNGYNNIITANKKKLDLLDSTKTLRFLKQKKPIFIFIAAAKVGGIYSNSKYKADYIYENLTIQTNLIHGAYLAGIKNIIFLGSSCVYPKKCKQPIREQYLLRGELENTNDAYAVAKIAGLKCTQAFDDPYMAISAFILLLKISFQTSVSPIARDFVCINFKIPKSSKHNITNKIEENIEIFLINFFILY